MNVNRLPVKTFLAHLYRHPMPELMDKENLSALKHIEAQYGNVLSFGAGLEIRLECPEKYADFILCQEEPSLFPGAVTWHELDYEAYRQEGEIYPCLFLNTWDSAEALDKRLYWERVFYSFLERDKAEDVKEAFFCLLEKLPENAMIKQIGCMARPGEEKILRIVIIFEDWKQLAPALLQIGWKGNAQLLEESLTPYADTDRIAVNIDLSLRQIREKIGIEISPPWRHPLLVDKMIARLEHAGLCLPEKAAALRRWIRIFPDADPFIQTHISYYKLSFLGGRFTEAKAYLEQSPCKKHRFFSAYDRPLYVELIVSDHKNGPDMDRLMAWLEQLSLNQVKELCLYGAEKEPAADLLIRNAVLRGIRELVITGFCPESDPADGQLLWEDLKQVVTWIKSCKDMKITVDSCCSPLRAVTGGKVIYKNDNYGINMGCTAGRNHFCIGPNGVPQPCRYLPADEDEPSLSDYWLHSSALDKLRNTTTRTSPYCTSCIYQQRCLPCPALALSPGSFHSCACRKES